MGLLDVLRLAASEDVKVKLKMPTGTVRVGHLRHTAGQAIQVQLGNGREKHNISGNRWNALEKLAAAKGKAFDLPPGHLVSAPSSESIPPCRSRLLASQVGAMPAVGVPRKDGPNLPIGLYGRRGKTPRGRQNHVQASQLGLSKNVNGIAKMMAGRPT
jgi:hypothetical protein